MNPGLELSEEVLFNLIVNGTFSFLAGVVVVALGIRFFRVPPSKAKLYLLTLPFIKILWDIFRGIPKQSYLYTPINPLEVPPGHSFLGVGAGLSGYGPLLKVTYSIRDSRGFEHLISLADYLREWLKARYSPDVPLAMLYVLLGTAALLLARRLVAGILFELKRRANRRGPSSVALERRESASFFGSRAVDVYVSRGFSGTPFTGGVFRPYICIPADTRADLSPPELEAVVKHELAHIRNGDLLITFSIQVLGDLFWFVPGYRALSRKIDRLRELLADRAAVAQGAAPEQLASALVRIRESRQGFARVPVLYSALIRERSLLKLRVEDLIAGGERSAPKGRWGWKNPWLRAALAAWMTGGVMLCSLGGNDALEKLPLWAESLLRSWGWMQ
jgi:hypothetical protein